MTKAEARRRQRQHLEALWREGRLTPAEAARETGVTVHAVRCAWRSLAARYGIRPVPGQLELW